MKPLPNDLEGCFARYCRTSDAAALARLFDLAAPELLSVAIHVTGDVAAAEDLVQSTFLKVIERREAIHPQRAGMGWLVNVLRQEAIDRRRRRGREVHVGEGGVPLEEIAARVEAADLPLQRQELSEAVQRAVAELPEPYRRVVTLRLRHGASAPEIADITGVSVGAVRTQLHRGIEKLRKSLPASTVMALLGAAVSPAGGLDAIRSTVLEHAAHLAPTAAGVSLSTATIQTAAMTTTSKLIAGGALVLASVVLWTMLRGESAGDANAVPLGQVAGLPDALDEAPDSEPALIAVPLAGSPVRTAAADDPPAAVLPFQVNARVVDAETGEPVPGALVEVFGAQELTTEQAYLEAPEFFVAQRGGHLGARTRNEWPIFRGAGKASNFLDEPVQVATVPDTDALPFNSTLTDGEGHFGLMAPDGASLLRVRADGYPDRHTSTGVTAETDSPEGAEGRALRVLRLHRNYSYAGKIQGLEPEDFPLELALTDHGDERGSFAARVWTDDEGSFEVSAPASHLRASSLTRGLHVERSGVNGNHQLFVRMERGLLLRFVNDETGEPLDRVRLRTIKGRSLGAWEGGEFITDDGYHGWIPSFGRNGDEKEGAYGVHAWAPGFAPEFLTVTEKDVGEEREVRLTPGALPKVSGRLLNGGKAMSGVVVELIGEGRGSWNREDYFLMDAARTDASGRFSLEGLPGGATLGITSELGDYVQEVHLPVAGSVEIDLASTGSIAIHVQTVEGAPVADHTVLLRGTEGFQVWAITDAEGCLLTEGLGPGTFEASMPLGQGMRETVELRAGEDRVVRLVTHDPNLPRYLRITDGRSKTYEGWRARTSFEDWTPIRSDGVVPIDLNGESYTLRVHAADGRRWRISLPKDAPDGYLLELPGGDAVITGTVRNEDGSPVAGVAVEAYHQELTAKAAARTQPDGTFRLEGLSSVSYWLSLRTRPDDAFDEDSDNLIRHYRFKMLAPADENTELDLVLVSAQKDLTVTGSVTEADGRAPSGVLVAVHSLAKRGPVEVQLPRVGAFGELDPDGGFSFTTLRGDSVRVQIYSEDLKLLRTETLAVPATGDLPPFRFVL